MPPWVKVLIIVAVAGAAVLGVVGAIILARHLDNVE